MADPFAFDPEKLKAESEDAERSKRWLNAAGDVVNQLTSVQSPAEIMLGQQRRESTAGNGLKSFAAGIQDPAERQAKLYAQYKQAKEAEAMKREEEKMAQLRDPNSAQSKAARYVAQKYGIPLGENASAYDTNDFIDPKKMLEQEARSQIDFNNAKALKRYELGLDLDKLKAQYSMDPKKSGPVGQFERLAPEDQEAIKDLGKKNANKTSIANQIDAVMGNWDSLSEEQKIVQGRSLLKTLNSSEGADAIGTDEAKRLGGLLENKIFNLTEPGPMFGRDIEGFATQARDASKNMKSAVQRNRSEIDRLYGRTKGIDPSGLTIDMNKKDVQVGPQKAQAKKPEEMTDAELDAELARLGIK